ncbi:MAG TPA: protease modulator HflC, partial [Methylophilaceae bacterium]|nr:protease modulator HflC [Methylophilaceae bacterium]
MKNIGTLLVGLVTVLVILWMSAFTVDQREFALVFRLGEIVSVKKEPGIYFKIPLVENVKHLEKRIVTLDWEAPAKFNTSENKYMMVDSFVKWRIADVKQYYISVGGDEMRAQTRLQ